MTNYNYKEFVNECTFSNVNSNRYSYKDVIINGRSYRKYGTVTATTAVCMQFKTTDPSTNNNEYIVLMGVAHQNPCDIKLSSAEGYEIASENALISPVAVFKFKKECSKRTMVYFMKDYINELPVQFIKTRQEIEMLGKDLNDFNRNTRIVGSDYYNDYYNSFKKYFSERYE